MPCYDKKLEASRADFVDEATGVRHVRICPTGCRTAVQRTAVQRTASQIDVVTAPLPDNSMCAYMAASSRLSIVADGGLTAQSDRGGL